jgi:hypothetical protein
MPDSESAFALRRDTLAQWNVTLPATPPRRVLLYLRQEPTDPLDEPGPRLLPNLPELLLRIEARGLAYT